MSPQTRRHRPLGSIDEISDFLLDTERSAGVPTLVAVVNTRNWGEHLWETEVNLSDPTFGRSVTTLGMDASTISPSSPVYQARFALVSNVLTRAGYTEEEAKAAFENRLALEKKLIQAAKEADNEQNVSSDFTILRS